MADPVPARGKPVVLAVDDEPQVLAAVERDLRRRYAKDYRIVRAGSGAEALGAARQLAARGDSVALFLSDQRMPEMTGTEMLSEARTIFPDAKKVLLTAYADTEAAIASINKIGLDYYLMKPWDPPEEKLYPVVDDLLADWAATRPATFDGIRVAGTLWSPASHATKDFLSQNQIPYRWLDVERDAEAARLVEAVHAQATHALPVVFFPDGTTLVAPTDAALAEKVGLRTRAERPFYDLVILGAGPAGLAAAVYGASEGLRTVLVEKKAPGGQAGTSSFIENYLGFPKGLSGADLARRAATQAKRFGVEILSVEATKIGVDDVYRSVTLSNGSVLSCHAIVLATGVTVRTLDEPGVERLAGRGVYYGAALSEAALYKDTDVFVVGGANSAGQGALLFARHARKVTMLVRGDGLASTMSHYLIEQIAAVANVEIRSCCRVVEAHGEQKLEAVTLEDKSGARQTVPASAMFVFIGAAPHTELVAGLCERDRVGFVLTGPDLGGRPKGWTLPRDPYPLETSVPGIFAAGDVRCGSTKRVATAVGEGAQSIAQVHAYLKTV